MKANDIQIGDWLYSIIDRYDHVEKKLCKVTGIRTDSDTPLIQCDDTDVWYPLDSYEPVPLTEEVLKKNGFEVQDQGGGRKDVWIGFGIDCEGDIEVEFQYNIPIHLKIDGGFKGEYYTSANITYFHQLQHALRLCRIDKTIEL